MANTLNDAVMRKGGANIDGPVSHEKIAPWLQGRSFEDCKTEYDREGYIIFENVMGPDEIARIRAALAPHLTKLGRNDFEGFKSNRVYALIDKSPEVFGAMAMHPLALAFVEAELGYSGRLSALLAINLHPGETVQDWHYDDSHIQVPLPRAPFGVSTFWAIDDMTETNGATEIVPKSHLWGEEDRISTSSTDELFDQSKQDIHVDPHPHKDAKKVVMPAGSLMVAKGTLWHRGGANRSEAPRLIVTPQYCSGWARQLENMVLTMAPEKAATLPKRVRELMGYSIHGGFMGYVDGVHPERLLGNHESH